MPVDEEIAAARAEDESARKERLAASKKLLDSLKRAAAKKQFEAIGGESGLEPEHRRELIAHIDATTTPQETPKVAPIAGGVATPFEIWRSRLRYRIVPVAVKAFVGLAFVGALGVAYLRTPDDLVVSAYENDVAYTWTFNGRQYAGPLRVRHPYARMSVGAQQSVIRDWLPSLGYAQAVVSNEALVAAPPGAKL